MLRIYGGGKKASVIKLIAIENFIVINNFSHAVVLFFLNVKRQKWNVRIFINPDFICIEFIKV